MSWLCGARANKFWSVGGRLVGESITIPSPRIHVYRLGNPTDARALSCFLIFEYVEGKRFKYGNLKAFPAE